MLRFSFNIDNVDLCFAETERGFQRLNQTCAILRRDRDSVLNDLNSRAESLDLFQIDIDAHDVVVDPGAEITLLLKEFEKFSRLGFSGN